MSLHPIVVLILVQGASRYPGTATLSTCDVGCIILDSGGTCKRDIYIQHIFICVYIILYMHTHTHTYPLTRV